MVAEIYNALRGVTTKKRVVLNVWANRLPELERSHDCACVDRVIELASAPGNHTAQCEAFEEWKVKPQYHNFHTYLW